MERSKFEELMAWGPRLRCHFVCVNPARKLRSRSLLERKGWIGHLLLFSSPIFSRPVAAGAVPSFAQ